MIDQIFSNADYYKNKEFQKLMKSWNVLDEFKRFDEPKIYEQVKENLMHEFYRKSKEWLMHNYDEDEWKYGLE